MILKPGPLGYNLLGMPRIRRFQINNSVCYFEPCDKWLNRIQACPDCLRPRTQCLGGTCTHQRRVGGGSSSADSTVAERVEAIRKRAKRA